MLGGDTKLRRVWDDQTSPQLKRGSFDRRTPPSTFGVLAGDLALSPSGRRAGSSVKHLALALEHGVPRDRDTPSATHSTRPSPFLPVIILSGFHLSHFGPPRFLTGRFPLALWIPAIHNVYDNIYQPPAHSVPWQTVSPTHSEERTIQPRRIRMLVVIIMHFTGDG